MERRKKDDLLFACPWVIGSFPTRSELDGFGRGNWHPCTESFNCDRNLIGFQQRQTSRKSIQRCFLPQRLQATASAASSSTVDFSSSSDESDASPPSSFPYTRTKRAKWSEDDLSRLPAHLRPMADESLDVILRKKILLLQARRGYRANTDSQIIAFFALKCFRHKYEDSKEWNRDSPLHMLDVGCGNGLVSILLMKSLPYMSNNNIHISMVEMQSSLANRAVRNMELNGIPPSQFQVIEMDISKADRSSQSLRHPCDLVVCNPPFYSPAGGRVAPTNTEKKLAHFESSADLETFFEFFALTLNEKGLGCVIIDITERARLLNALSSVSKLHLHYVQYIYHSILETSPIRICVGVSLQPILGGEWIELEPMYLHDDPNEIVYRMDHEAWLESLHPPRYRIGAMRMENFAGN